MDVKELLDDESLDPKKFFDEKEYVTLLIGREGFNKNQNDSADLIERLLEKNISRAETEEIFIKLKHLNANKLLIDTLKSAKTDRDKAKLCVACWESGLDFTSHFLFFTELACSKDFALAMEALTVVESIEGIILESDLTKGIEIAQNSKSKNASIVEFLIGNIKQRIA
jgi:hypothetical protein